MKQNYTLKILCLAYFFFPSMFFQLSLQAQISIGGEPYSFNHPSIKAEIPTAKMPKIDLAALKAEDALNESNKQVYRFGKSIEVSLNLDNSGVWQTLPNGDKLWRLQIHSKDAKSINLIYSDFYLPKGGKLFLYNANRSEVLGAFTSKNNKSYRKFSTSLLKGDKTILEYYEPANVAGKGVIQISEVIHGYRSFQRKIEKGYGDSGDCNVNVNCMDGNDWQVQKRSVAMIIAGGKRDCTGALVNNVRQDGTPYFLSANHCLPNNSEEIETWLFVFNYESPTCFDEDGRLDQAVSGAVLRAASADSDFALLELSEVPPLEYSIYYAGWSAEDVAVVQSTCIHHPAGDIKKITFNEDLLVSDNIDGTPPNTFWKVTEWEKGTTEGGSSGSPLFDFNKRIVGQLYGGLASCNNIAWDTYGKFSYSWNGKNSIDTRLRDWLDPDNTGVLIIDGKEGNAPVYELDASILSLASPAASICGEESISPMILIRNVGSELLSSVRIDYQIDDNPPQSTIWEGSLDFFDSEWLTLPTTEAEIGIHTIVVTVQNPNGKTDMNESNNAIEYDFEVVNGSVLKVDLTTDNFGAETSFQIADDEGNVLYEENNFDNARAYDFEYCLPPACYTFTILDSYEGPDGLGDGICCANGEGSYSVGLKDGTVLGTGGEFRSSETVNFCIEDKTLLDAAFSANETQVCKGDAVQFTALSTGAATYLWTFEGGTPAISNERNPLVVFEDWGNFNVTLKVTNSISEDELQEADFIEVRGTDISVDTFNASNPISEDGRVEWEVVSSSPIEELNYEWTNGLAAVNPNQLQRGNYTVVVTDAHGCSESKQFFIGSDILPIVAMVQVDSRKICEGQTVHLIDVSNNDAVARQWIFEGAALSQSSESSVYLQYTEVGSHDVQLIVEDEYTRDTLILSDFIEVGNVPDVAVQMVSPRIGQSDGGIELNLLNGTPATTYKWNTGATSSKLGNLSAGIYTVTVTNESGCQKVLTIELKTDAEVSDGYLIYPNPVTEGVLFFYNDNPSDVLVSFKMYSLEGRLMGEWRLEGNERNYELDVSDLPTGVYMLWSNIGEKERKEKVILLND